MAYIDSNLVAGETVVHRAQLHWMRFFWGAFWLAIGLASSSTMGCLPWFVLGISLTVMAYVDIVTSEFVVTNKRIYLKQGVIRRTSTELFLDKVESVQVNQSVLGRMMNFGSIVPSGTGGTRQPFSKISNPLAFRQKVSEQIDMQRGGGNGVLARK